MAIMKHCSVCGKEKSTDEFYVKDKRTGRLFTWCKDCHCTKSKVSYRAGGEKNRARNREYARDRYREEPEIVKEQRRKHYYKDIERSRALGRECDARRKESRKQYKQDNADYIKAQNAEYRRQNRDRIKAQNAEYRRNNREILRVRQQEWRKENPERYSEIHSRWKKANKSKVNASTHRRRARLAGCSGDWTAQEWEDLKAACGYTCLCCGRQEPEIKLTVDHVIPVSRGGDNRITNIQPLCKECNSAKHTLTTDHR